VVYASMAVFGVPKASEPGTWTIPIALDRLLLGGSASTCSKCGGFLRRICLKVL
jgi:hypothetical protein